MITRLTYVVLASFVLTSAAFGQATPKAPNALGSVTTPATTDQLYVCQTIGGCDLSGSKPLKQETITQLFSLVANFITSAIVCPVLGLTCVKPTGVSATDTAAIQAAVNISGVPVVLLPGTFVTNATITLTTSNAIIMGWSGSPIAGLPGSGPPYPGITTVDCSALIASSPHGCFDVTNKSAHFSGFHILANGTSGRNCISVGDSGTVIDGNMALDNCNDGVHIDLSVGTTTGYALNTHINHTYIAVPGNYGIYCNNSCTDFFFGPDIEIEEPLGAGIHCDVNCGDGHIYGITIEDGSQCLEFNGAVYITVTNFRCNRASPLVSTNAGAITITNSIFNGVEPQGTDSRAMWFYGGNSEILITNNIFGYNYLSCYFVDPAATVSGNFTNNDCHVSPAGNVRTYYDTFSESVIDPLVTHPVGSNIVANTSGTFAAPDWQYGFNVVLPMAHGANTLTNPVYISAGQQGTASFQQSPVGGDTIGTYGNQYQDTVTLSSGAYQTDIFPWLTTSTGIVFGTKIATLTPNANLLTGGNAMTSGWSGGRGTLTTNVVSDPVGGSTGAKFAEDNTSGYHGVVQTLSGFSLGTTYTCAIWYNKGTSANRNVGIDITDASSNEAYVLFDKTTGAEVSNSGAGVVSWGLAGTASGGWIRVYMSFNMPAAPAVLDDVLSQYPVISYTGVPPAFGEFWGPTCRLGTSP